MTNKKTAALLLALLIAAGTVAGCSTYDTIPVNGSSSETSTADDSKAESQTESSDTETSATSESSSETSQPNSNSSEDANTSKEPSSKPNGDSSSDSSESSSSKPSSKPSGDTKSEVSSKPSSGSSSSSSSKPSSSGNSSSSQTSKPSSKPAHSHSYSSKVTKPTCTKQGYTTHTCSCGKSYTDSYTEATGHSWSEWKTVKKATTKSEGKKERTCESCGKTETKSIPKVESSNGGTTSSSGHAITGARKAVYSYSGDHGDKWSNVNLVDLLNEERAKRGLCKLEWTADLYYQDYKDGIMTDEEWGSEFIVNGKFDPYNCSEVKNVLNAAQIQADRQVSGHGNGVYASCVSEVWGYGTIEQSLREAMKAYLDSPGHYDLLMSPGSHRVTAAYAIGKNGHVYTAITCGG